MNHLDGLSRWKNEHLLKSGNLDGSHRWSNWMKMIDGETNIPLFDHHTTALELCCLHSISVHENSFGCTLGSSLTSGIISQGHSSRCFVPSHPGSFAL